MIQILHDSWQTVMLITNFKKAFIGILDLDFNENVNIRGEGGTHDPHLFLVPIFPSVCNDLLQRKLLLLVIS